MLSTFWWAARKDGIQKGERGCSEGRVIFMSHDSITNGRDKRRKGRIIGRLADGLRGQEKGKEGDVGGACLLDTGRHGDAHLRTR